MKINRRAFLSFMAGGAAGTALSPLPWKLIDDSSIWSQAWPWIPVPKGGESTYVNTVCTLCSGGCGIVVRKVGNRVIKIEGLKKDTVGEGKICSLGLSGPQLLYSPTRVQSPMLRDDSGCFKKITWDKAIALVIEKLDHIRKAGNAHKVACIADTSEGTVSNLFKRLLYSYGSSNFLAIPKSEDIVALTLKDICGVYGKIAYNFEGVDFVLMLGADNANDWSSPVKMIKLITTWMKDDFVKVIHVNSRYSETSSKSDSWISINPGSESDLSFGMATYIIKNELYDKSFVSQNESAFLNLKNILLGNYSLEIVSKNTGVGIDTISYLANSFIKAKKHVIMLKESSGVLSVGYKDYASLLVLNFLKGSINKKDGIRFYKDFEYRNWPDIRLDDLARESLLVGSNLIDINCKQHKFSKFMDSLMNIVDFDNKSLEALFFLNSNPSYVLPNANVIQKTLKRTPFLVTFSSFMDETALISNLILPDHLYLEKFQDVSFFNGKEHSVGISVPVVLPVFETKHVGDIILSLAHAFGGTISESFPWVSYNECLEFTLGNKLSYLQKNNEKLLIENNGNFLKLDKFDFTRITLSDISYNGDFEFFPLTLVLHDSLRLTSGYVFSPPFLVKTVDDSVLKKDLSFVDINPCTAKSLGLVEKSFAILSIIDSKIKVKVGINYCNSLKPGVISIVRGLGHTAYDEYISGKGVNVNDIIKSTKDPVLGHDIFYSIRAKLSKA